MRARAQKFGPRHTTFESNGSGGAKMRFAELSVVWTIHHTFDHTFSRFAHPTHQGCLTALPFESIATDGGIVRFARFCVACSTHQVLTTTRIRIVLHPIGARPTRWCQSAFCSILRRLVPSPSPHSKWVGRPAGGLQARFLLSHQLTRLLYCW